MSPEAQRIAIAEACGKRRHSVTFDPCSRGGLWVCRHCHESYCCPPWTQEMVELEWCDDELHPDYLADLNACHDMEKLFYGDSEKSNRYAEFVLDVLEIPTPFIGTARCAFLTNHADAVTRCEAFLRTLNLWDDTK